MNRSLLIGVAAATLFSTLPVMTAAHAEQSVQIAQAKTAEDKAAAREARQKKKQAERKKKLTEAKEKRIQEREAKQAKKNAEKAAARAKAKAERQEAKKLERQKKLAETKKLRLQQFKAKQAKLKAERAAARAKAKAERQEAKKVERAAARAKAKAERQQANQTRRAKIQAEKAAARAEARTKKQEANKAQKAAEREAKRAEAREKKQADRKAKRKAARAAARKQANQKSDTVEDGVLEADTEKNAAVAVVREKRSAAQRKRAKQRERLRRERKRKNRRNVLGAFAAGAVVGTVVKELGGRVVKDQGDRIVVERDGRYIVRRDEDDLLKRKGVKVFSKVLPNGNLRTTAYRRNGVRITSVRDTRGALIRRIRRNPNGDRIVLFDNRESRTQKRRDYRRELGAVRVEIPREDYIVETRRADRRALRRALAAKPVERVERDYTLNEIRNSERLRQKTRRVDLDTLTFDTGEFALSRGQVDRMADVAGAMNDIVSDNPREIFLVEGHTDAVGSEVSNLTLSDRRAESVARILSEFFEVPPENLVVQGYGETNLKVATEGNERRNRRVTVRRITPLLRTASQ